MVVTFTSVGTGRIAGSASIKDGELHTEGIATSMRATEFGMSMTPIEFLRFYAVWSNGYVSGSVK